MRGPELLKHYEDNWETEMGAWFPGERVVVRGTDLFEGFSSAGWMEYLLFVVTGKRDAKLARLIESIWVYCTSFPDPRLWNNRVATLAATAGSTGVLGVSAGIAVSEATVYGLKPIKGVCDFLIRSKEKLDSGEDLEEIVRKEISAHKSLYGYGRPMTSCDERIKPTIAMAEELGFASGDYLKLALDIEEILYKKYKMKMNIAAVYAALMSDVGLSVMDTYYMACLSFSAGMFAPFIEAQEKPLGAFFPLRVSRLNYEGIEGHRVWGNKND